MLPKENRLTAKSDFEAVRENGRMFSGRNFSLSYRNRGDEKKTRFGFVVSKKVSKRAVERNRAKRVLREIVRKNISSVKAGFDCIFLVKKAFLGMKSSEVEVEVKEALKKFEII